MTFNPFSLSSYHYHLPEELIAQHPCTPRDQSRLLVVNRTTGNFSEMVFRDLVDFLGEGDSLVFNNTKVIPARLIGKRLTGGESEIFLISKKSNDCWEVLARPGKKLQPGTIVKFGEDFWCEILEILNEGHRLVRFNQPERFEEMLQKYGEIPLPHYIKREEKVIQDQERYQTVFAASPGAVAAPTAGLHFSENMMQMMQSKGISNSQITLHVGLGTFRPVQVDDIRTHKMHTEKVMITPESALTLNQRLSNKYQICVGTTCCRALESASDSNGKIPSGEFETNIFIYPGYRFKYVKQLLTNFHLPGSSLLMLVSAFAGYDLTMEAYKKAVKDRYRFFSYGDAMLII